MKCLITFFLFVILFVGCKKEDSNPVTQLKDTPTVKIVTPVNNQNVIDSITIQIEASDPKGVTKVELFIQNVKVKEFAVKPYTYFWEVKDLIDSSKHSIYAKAFNSDDKVTGSEVIEVTINRLSPSNLQILSFTKDTVHLKWNDNSIIEDSYVVQVSTDSTNFSTISELPANTTVAGIAYSFSFGVEYFFRIGAKKVNTVSYSSILSGGPIPDPSVLLTPVNNATEQPLNPTLSWSTISGATSYRLQVSPSNNFTSFVYNQSGLTNTSQQLSGLNPLTQYYWRVNATNSYGTSSWSTVWNFTTTDQPCPGIPNVTYSGKTYNTVLIGSQCWLKENLNVGTRINGSQNQIDNSTIEKYCYNDQESNCGLYGGLYQWNEAMQYTTTAGAKGICPPGWHIPTNAELQTLASSVGNIGNALKEVGQGSGAGSGTNTSGFSALLAGNRGSIGGFYYLGVYTNFWSSTGSNASNAYYRNLTSSDSSILFDSSNKNNGFSVRCVQD